MVKLFILICLTVLCTCISCFKKSFEALNRISVKERKVKLNGYYYTESSNSSETFFSTYFLYSNGVIRYCGSKKTLNLIDIDAYILKEYVNSKPLNNSRVGWGVFSFDNKFIEYDMWYPRADAPVYKRKGIILNDSTFVIKSVSKSDGREFKEENIIYHFRKFSPKPDSTNNFIK